MRLVLVAIGRMKSGPERELLQRYLSRAQMAARALGISGVVEVEVEESRARQPEQRKAEEAEAVLAKLPAGARVVCLDERGRNSTSADLAKSVGVSRDRGQAAFCFVIGGPDGLAPGLLAAHETLSFGALTIPHQMVRVLMAEQMYRVMTILSGHPYHRA